MKRTIRLKTRNRKRATGNRTQKTVEPLAEGIQMKRPCGFFSRMNDEELVTYAKRSMNENGIRRRDKLKNADPGLYKVLGKRGLLDKVGFEEKRQKERSWKEMSDDTIVQLTEKFMKEKGICRRTQLCRADGGLYRVLRMRGLMGRVGFEERYRSWKEMQEEEIIRHAKRFIKGKKIRWRGELQRADHGLYHVLRKKGLLDRLGLGNLNREHRDWQSLTDEAIILHASRFMKENGISGRKELEKADLGLYGVLRKRGLLDRIGFEEKKRSWENMEDEEVIEYAKKLLKNKGIRRRADLETADPGLYTVLRIRKLLDKLSFKEKLRWNGLKDEDIIEFAKRFMKENGITGRSELEKADRGLYQVLVKRGLLNRLLFEEKRRSWKDIDDEELIKYSKRLMKEKGIRGRAELEKADKGLYRILRKRGLLDRIGFEEKKRLWKKMKDEEIIEHAKDFIEKNGICRKKELQKVDNGLYLILYRRKLISSVFSPIERSTSEKAIEQIIDFTASFGERR